MGAPSKYTNYSSYHCHLHVSKNIFSAKSTYYYNYSLIRAFHISVSRWFFTGVWVTASFLKSPGLFSAFWPFSIMLSFEWSPLVRQLPSPPVPVPSAPITIGIIVTCMFHGFFNSQARSRYLSFFSHSFSFILWSAGTAKSTILQVPFFLLIIIKSGLLAGIKWSVCMLKSHRSLCVAFSRTGAGLCIYHLLLLFTPLVFFTSVLADGFSLESEWQQVSLLLYSFESSSHQRFLIFFLLESSDSKSPQVSWTLLNIPANLNNAVIQIVSPSSPYFQVLQSLNQSFGDYTECTTYYWYYSHLYVP